MVDPTAVQRHAPRSSRLVTVATVFVIVSIILAVFFIITNLKAAAWISVFALFLVLSVTALFFIIKRRPLGRSLAIWAPWISLACSMPIFHRALFYVTFDRSTYIAINETVTFFFCFAYTLIMLPASILLLLPAAQTAFSSPTASLPPDRTRLPWPVRVASILYCAPIGYGLVRLGREIAAKECNWYYDYFIDIGLLGLLVVGIGLAYRHRYARYFALALPFVLFGASFILQREFPVGEYALLSFTSEAQQCRWLALVTAPAIIFLNLPNAKRAFMPVASTSSALTAGVVSSPPEEAPKT